MFQCLTCASCERSTRRCERSFRCSLSRSGLEEAVFPPGPNAGPTHLDLKAGCLGRVPVARAYRVCSASPHSWPRRSACEIAGLPRGNTDANIAHSDAASWERDRHRPVGPAHVYRRIRAERLESAETASAAPVSVLRTTEAPGPWRGLPIPGPHVSTGRRDSPRANLARCSSSRDLAARCLATMSQRASMRDQ